MPFVEVYEAQASTRRAEILVNGFAMLVVGVPGSKGPNWVRSPSASGGSNTVPSPGSRFYGLGLSWLSPHITARHRRNFVRTEGGVSSDADSV
jgi:hypothetical protein